MERRNRLLFFVALRGRSDPRAIAAHPHTTTH